MKAVPTLAFLVNRRTIVIEDLKLKIESDDWHGVADCAMDLREIDAKIEVLMAQEAKLQLA